MGWGKGRSCVWALFITLEMSDDQVPVGYFHVTIAWRKGVLCLFFYSSACVWAKWAHNLSRKCGGGRCLSWQLGHMPTLTLLIGGLVSLAFMNVSVSFCGKYPKIIKPILIFCQCWGTSIVPTKLHFSIQLPTRMPRDTWKAAGSSAGPKPQFSYRCCSLPQILAALLFHTTFYMWKDFSHRLTRKRVGERKYCPCFSQWELLPRQFHQCIWGCVRSL